MIPFNRASFDGNELVYLAKAVANGHTSGNGPFTQAAEGLLRDIHCGGTALLTTSCTHALEMAARLLDLQPGDEVIVPAFTFVSTASAFVWNGARPVFADVRADTMNIDPDCVESLINERTRAICIVHYAGVAADPDAFVALAHRHGLVLIEDNAHGLGASYRNRRLGTFGSMSTLSFHETKNVTCGEGGAIVLNDTLLVERAEILREKGTDRSRFLRGQVDKYTWVDLGSSWVLSDLLAGVLVGQLERFSVINDRRVALWEAYNEALAGWAADNGVEVPTVPDGCSHVGHLYYLVLPSQRDRDAFIGHLRQRGVYAVFHYQSLDTSPMGRHLCAPNADVCPNSAVASSRLVRLPLFASMTALEQDQVVSAATSYRVRTTTG